MSDGQSHIAEFRVWNCDVLESAGTFKISLSLSLFHPSKKTGGLEFDGLENK